MTDSLRIFLAHASEDKPQVRQLYQRLREAGYRPWMDEEDLIPGQNWQDEITRAIKRSDIFIACFSSRSVIKQGDVQREFRLALNKLAEMPAGEIYLIPLKLDNCEIPDLRQAEYGVNLRDIQWFDYWRSEGWRKLLQAIKLKVEQSPSVQQRSSVTTMAQPREQTALDIWREKLGDYERQEAIASDPEQKFRLKKLIQECRQKIKQLEE